MRPLSCRAEHILWTSVVLPTPENHDYIHNKLIANIFPAKFAPGGPVSIMVIFFWFFMSAYYYNTNFIEYFCGELDQPGMDHWQFQNKS